MSRNYNISVLILLLCLGMLGVASLHGSRPERMPAQMPTPGQAQEVQQLQQEQKSQQARKPHQSQQARKTRRPRHYISIAFWNAENLFDTIPSDFYDDREYTPGGDFGWDTERYSRKLRNMARVIDDMGADVVGLAEVENEAVVRDLVNSLADDYNYIHRTSGDGRGIDLALLYRGDKFFPDRVRLINSGSSREFLHIRGLLSGDMVDLLVCHLPSKANRRDYRERVMIRLRTVADSLRSADRSAKLIVMGDFNCDPSEGLFRRTLGRRSGGFYDEVMLYGGVAGDSGQAGSYAYGGQWYLLDNIMLSSSAIYGDGLLYESGGVFVREYMIAGASGATGTADAYSGRGHRNETGRMRYNGGEDERNDVGSEDDICDETGGKGGANKISDKGAANNAGGGRDINDLRNAIPVPADRRGYPLRTFTSGRYTAGYSDHLPVYVVLSR